YRRAAVAPPARARKENRGEGVEGRTRGLLSDCPPPPPDHRWSRGDSRFYIPPCRYGEPVCNTIQLCAQWRWFDYRAGPCPPADTRFRTRIAPARPPTCVP